MKKSRLRIFMGLILIVVMLFSLTTTAQGTEVVSAKKFNVVFALDASKSMRATDKEGWRYEAIEEFLSLLSADGNYVGSVTFNGDIVSESPVSRASSKTDKKTIADSLRDTTPVGYTNIGVALKKANEMLNNVDSNLPSIIILLSDGNTMTETKEKYAQSMKIQREALAEASREGTEIYCVGLNANGKVDAKELKNIAEQTGGKYKIVSKARDLEKVFRDFYKMIYRTNGDESDKIFPSSGILNEEFKVPKIGVEEVNILINGNPSEITLTQPSGVSIDSSELSEMMFKGKNFMNIKIEEPLSGQWQLKLKGKPGQKVKINFLPNLDVALNTVVDERETFKRNEVINLRAQIVSKGQTISDASIYQEYPLTIIVTESGNASTTKKITATVEKDAYTAQLQFDKVGTYYITPAIDIGYGEVKADTVQINVGNIPPKAEKDDYKFTKFALSFGEKTFSYDLNELVTDEDGEALFFSVDRYTFASDEFSLENGILSVTPAEAGEGSISIIASDASGASCSFTLELVYRNLLLVLLVGIGILIVVGGGTYLLLKHKSATKPFGGSVTITAYDQEGDGFGAPMTEWPPRGGMDIEKINIDAYNVGKIKGTVYGTGGDSIILKLKGTAFYRGSAVKKVEIRSGLSEQIESAEGRGIEITFTRDYDY